MMDDAEFKALMQVAAKWQQDPTGIYPWEAKKQYKSVKTPFGVGLEPIPQPELAQKETTFIDVNEVEMPDPGMIHIGEVAGYVNALVPIILTQEKDASGKWIIFDGRHRVAAWRAAGYKQIPVVFLKSYEVPGVIKKAFGEEA